MNRRIMEEYVRGSAKAPASAAAEPPEEPDEEVTSGKIYRNGDVLVGEHTIRRNCTVRCELPRFVVGPDTFLNKSVIFYGPSKSGKTHLTKYCMAQSSSIFPNVIIMCPTAEDTGDYSGRVPEQMIHDKVQNPYILKVYQRQKAAAKIFKMVNDPDRLFSLFRRVATEKESAFVASIDAAMREALARPGADEHAVRNEYIAKRVNIMRVVITNSLEVLHRDAAMLSAEDQVVLKYLNFNPRLMMIFDDAMTEITRCLKAKDNSIDDFFFKGRHAFITHFYLFQDDANMPPDLRKNAFYSIFTSSGVARAFFARPSNGVDSSQKDYAEAAIRTVFAPENASKYCKLIYDRVENTFAYISAGPVANFRMCSDATWKLCETSSQGAGAIDSSNPFARRFAGGRPKR